LLTAFMNPIWTRSFILDLHGTLRQELVNIRHKATLLNVSILNNMEEENI
jgi:hypothetical protein